LGCTATLGGELARPGKKRWATCCWAAQKEKEKNKEALASSLDGEMSAALPVVGEKGGGGGGGGYRWLKVAGVD
jgi:hypothetical protein